MSFKPVLKASGAWGRACVTYVMNGQLGHLELSPRMPEDGRPAAVIEGAQQRVARRLKVSRSQITVIGIIAQLPCDLSRDSARRSS